jgi:spore coat protein U-like protein
MTLSRIANHVTWHSTALSALLLAFSLWHSTPAMAASYDNIYNCSASATGLAFGTVSPVDGAVSPPTATVTVTCQFDGSCSSGCTTTANVALNAGVNSATFSSRIMKSASKNSLMNYNVYTNSSRTIVFGDGTGATGQGALSFVCNQSTASKCPTITTSVTLYGAVPAGQYNLVPAADYADTLTVTVSY